MCHNEILYHSLEVYELEAFNALDLMNVGGRDLIKPIEEISINSAIQLQ